MTRQTENNRDSQRSCVKKSAPIKKRYFVLAILIVLLVFAGVKIFEHRKTISLYYSATKMSAEELQTMQKTNDEQIDSALNGITDTPMRSLTEEEEKQLQSGVLSEEEAMALIMGIDPATATPKPEQPQDSQNTQDKEKPTSVSTSRKNEIIAQIYLLRSEFLGKIDNVLNEQIAIYRTYPPKERTTSLKLQMADEAIAKGVALENQCDARMEALLSELQKELIKNGEDVSQIDTARELYNESKRIKKAELLAKYYPG